MTPIERLKEEIADLPQAIEAFVLVTEHEGLVHLIGHKTSPTQLVQIARALLNQALEDSAK